MCKKKNVPYKTSDFLRKNVKYGGYVLCALLLVTMMYVVGKISSFSKITMLQMDTEHVHVSVDDCSYIFQDLSIHQDEYNSIFDNSKLCFLKKLHDKYGLKVTLYVFYDWDLEADGFDLSQATDAFAQEFSDNSDWMRFGFHAADTGAYQNMETETVIAYYQKTIEELLRITGSEDCLESFVRLDRYTADVETVQALYGQKHAVSGLLIADRSVAESRDSYGLTLEERILCYENDWYIDGYGMQYTPTDIRLEDYTQDDVFLEDILEMSDQKLLTVFTHEWILDDPNVQRYLTLLSKIVYAKNIPFTFLS